MLTKINGETNKEKNKVMQKRQILYAHRTRKRGLSIDSVDKSDIPIPNCIPAPTMAPHITATNIGPKKSIDASSPYAIFPNGTGALSVVAAEL